MVCVGIARRELKSDRGWRVPLAERRQRNRTRGCSGEGSCWSRGAAIAGGTGSGEWRVGSWRNEREAARREVEKSGSGGCKPLMPAERRATPR